MTTRDLRFHGDDKSFFITLYLLIKKTCHSRESGNPEWFYRFISQESLLKTYVY